MQFCPKCQRKLISHTSARCNWCGSVIDDAQYQAQAEVNRESFRAQQQLHDLRLLNWQRNLTGIGPFGDPIFGAAIAPHAEQRMSISSAQRAAIRAQQMSAQPQPAASTSTDESVEGQTDVPWYYRSRR